MLSYINNGWSFESQDTVYYGSSEVGTATSDDASTQQETLLDILLMHDKYGVHESESDYNSMNYGKSQIHGDVKYHEDGSTEIWDGDMWHKL